MFFLKAFIVYLILIFSLVFSYAENSITHHAQGYGGAVAAEDSRAVEAGIAMLKNDGNATDAAVAVMLAASVVDYGMFSIGSEIPFMIYDKKSERVKTLSGLGSAPLDESSMKIYYEEGIPTDGGMRAVPVPGAMHLFFTALIEYGTMSFSEVAAPTLKILDRGGEDWYDELAITIRKLIERESNYNGSRKDKLKASRDRFYRGDIAKELVSYYEKGGSFLKLRDLSEHRTLIEDPVSIKYRGYTILKCGTWTQGPYLSQVLKILEGFDLKSMGHLSGDYIHVLAESLKLGLADRDHYYGDPRFVKVPMNELLSDQYTKIRRKLINMKSASLVVRPGDPLNMKALTNNPSKYRPGPGGTTTCVVADKWGNFVAATPSGNPPYNICEPLGIAHGNRLRSLNTAKGHPNRIEPGKRPRITLTPTLVMKDGIPIMGISVAGGDLQDQTTLNCLLNFIEFGMKPEKAVTASRFSTRHHENSFDPSALRTVGVLGGLTLNESIDKDVLKDLSERGHRVSTTGGPIAYPVMVYYDKEMNQFYAAGDPKANRHAAVIEPVKNK